MRKFLFLLMIVGMGGFSLDAQPPNFQSLYAHQAKSIYGPGEKLFNKVYIRQNNRLLMQPVNLYVDWYNADIAGDCSISAVCSSGLNFSTSQSIKVGLGSYAVPLPFWMVLILFLTLNFT